MITINIVKECFSEKHADSIMMSGEVIPEHEISFCRISYTFNGLDVDLDGRPAYVYGSFLRAHRRNYKNENESEPTFSAGFSDCWIIYNGGYNLKSINVRDPKKIPVNLYNKIEFARNAVIRLLNFKNYLQGQHE